jgi:hypothetical protein
MALARWLALAGLLALTALVGGSGAGFASPPAQAATSSTHGPSGASGAALWRAADARTAASWRDVTRATAFSLRPLTAGNALTITGAAAGTEYVFVLPDGSQVLGTNQVLTQLLVQLRSLGPGDPFDVIQSVCGEAERVFARVDAAGSAGKRLNAYTELGVAHLVLQIGQGGLIAYAGLSYGASGAVCTQLPTWEMMAGCVDAQTPADCTPPAPPALAAASYGTAFAAAVQSHDWSAVYALNSQTIQAQYSAASFAAVMNQGAAQEGQITSISAPLTTPLVSFDGDGQAYFIATQRITITTTRITIITTRQISSYFLLEGGAWRFWFSA